MPNDRYIQVVAGSASCFHVLFSRELGPKGEGDAYPFDADTSYSNYVFNSWSVLVLSEMEVQ